MITEASLELQYTNSPRLCLQVAHLIAACVTVADVPFHVPDVKDSETEDYNWPSSLWLLIRDFKQLLTW